MRDPMTGGYQYASRFNSRWEKPKGDIGPIRFVLIIALPAVAFVLLVAAVRS